MKPIGSTVGVTIRKGGWEGQRPVRGDVLRTKRGRTYLVQVVHWPKMRLLVVPADVEHKGREHRLVWGARKKRQSPR